MLLFTVFMEELLLWLELLRKSSCCGWSGYCVVGVVVEDLLSLGLLQELLLQLEWLFQGCSGCGRAVVVVGVVVE